MDPFQIRCRIGDLDLVVVLLNLTERQIQQAQCVLRFVTVGVIGLLGEQAEGNRAQAALADPWQIHLAILVRVANVPTQIELAVDHMHMPIHHEPVRLPEAGGRQEKAE